MSDTLKVRSGDFPNIGPGETYSRDSSASLHTSGVDDERPPICPACGVTMVPTALSEREGRDDNWICLECEVTGEPDAG